jgi:hypothetical protein
MSVMPFLRIVSLFDLESFLRPDPRVSRVRRLAILLRCMSPSERGVIWKMEDGPASYSAARRIAAPRYTDGSTRQTAATTCYGNLHSDRPSVRESRRARHGRSSGDQTAD